MEMNVEAVVIDGIRKAIERRCNIKVKSIVRLAYIMPDGTLKYLRINNRTSWFGVSGAKNAFQAEFGHFIITDCRKQPFQSKKEEDSAIKNFWKNFWKKNIVEIIVEDNVI